MHSAARFLIFTAAPSLVVAVLYAAALGHRSDYLGHYLAGCGGTLGLTALCLGLVPAEQFRDRAGLIVVGCCLGAIGLGAVFESTIYRIAKFDEVDFYNQSLGAVLASLATLATVAGARPKLVTFGLVLLFAAALVAAGYHYAFL